MENQHLTIDSLLALSGPSVNPDATGRAAAHLALCAACRDLLGQLPESSASIVRQRVATADPARRFSVLDYRRVIQKVKDDLLQEEARVAEARAYARQLFAELSNLAPTRRRMIVANIDRFQNWALAELLLQEARIAWTGDPGLAENHAVIACDIADNLHARGYRLLLLNDLRAEAWSFVANSYRIRGQISEAERTFKVAEGHLAQGTGELQDLAQLLDLKVSLLRDKGDVEAAFTILEQVIECRRSLGDHHLVGRALVSKAKLLRDWGRVEESVTLLREAESLIDQEREPLLELNLKINLMTYLMLLGRPEEARPMLAGMKQLARRIGGRVERLRAIWVEGRLLYSLGLSALGEELLKTAHEGFLNAGVAYEAASVALDLAAIYLDQGRADKVRELADRVKVYALLASSDAEREAVAALVGLHQQAQDTVLTRALIDQIAEQLRALTSRQSLADGEL